MLAMLAASPALSQALPTGGEVAAGSAVIGTLSPNSLTITQSSARAILNWKSFSVGDGQAVRFDNGRGATLNRVTGGDLSQIDGRLSASGSVYLINPAGVIVGANGVISTGGTFLASSLDLPDASFLAGGALTFSGSGDAGVVNLGRITAASGDILLIARNVENSRTLDAPRGTVGLAAGTQVSLADAQGAAGRLRVDLGSADASVTQSGRITSAVAELKTQNGNIYALAGNTGGEILAGSLTHRDGKVWIDAGEGAVQVDPGARIAAASGTDGGSVSINGGLVFNQGAVEASGRKGGEIRVSGGGIYNTGRIDASGKAGDGGRISVTASRGYIETTSGTLTATGTRRGGSLSVDGGASLYTSGTWSASAPGGVGGSITALGDRITLNEASLSADGGLGGRIRIGGDFRGLGDLRHALEVLSTPGSKVSAASDYARHGGSVVYWSTGRTEVWGRTRAAGAGLIEVSSKGEVYLGGLADAGVGGQVLLDPKSIVIDAASGVYPQFQLINPGSASDSGFGANILALSGGNVVVTASTDSVAAAGAGAVYLFNGITGALISTLTGSTASDGVGGNGVTALTNGNYVVRSQNWDNGAIVNAGAATWGSGLTGISGVVSAANSLVGSTANDIAGGGVTALTNGNYVVASSTWDNGAVLNAGAATWGSGTSGVSGAISAANSLVGSTANDQVGSDIIALTNGSYVVRSSIWDNGAIANAGAVTWGSGTTGITGVVSAANSLVGSTANDQVGSFGVTVLTNGNYLVRSQNWDNGAITNAGAVTWGSGSSGITGAISAANSLVGSTLSDQVGSGGVFALTNGNYVVSSPQWNNLGVVDVGAVTWGSGTTGISGAVSTANSLVGSNNTDQIGFSGVTVLTNGNYVVRSPYWDNGAFVDAGAVTWGSGTTGISGAVSGDNSLVGTWTSMYVGLSPVTALANGNYVVANPRWDNGLAGHAGAVTWGSGTTGIAGVASAANSLVGTKQDDRIGSGGVFALTNGNYVVTSPQWDNLGFVEVGAVTWGSGTTGITGAVSLANSLVGSNNTDQIGFSGVTVLTNGNYVVRSPYWDNGAFVDAGAVTWGSGTTGISGAVSGDNSLVGTWTSMYVGLSPVTALANGNYVVANPRWDNGLAGHAGAVTWGSGTTGIAGVASAANSLVGTKQDDQVGAGGVIALGNGNYIVRSTFWANGDLVDAGAVTLGSGSGGVTGAVSAATSLVGITTGEELIYKGAAADNSYVFASSNTTNRVLVGLTSLSQLTYNRAVGQTVTLQPSALAAQLATGSSLVLQASNDITLNSALVVTGSSGGALTLQAGRSLLINGNITTANGALNLYANTLLSSGVIDADRDAGAAVITMAPGTSISAGSGQVLVHLGPGTGKTHLTSGAISLGSITAAGITVENAGTSVGSNIVLNSGAVLAASGGGDAIRLAANGAFINNAGASGMSTPAGRWLVYSQQTNSAGLAPVGNVTGGLVGKSWYGIGYAFGSAGAGSFASMPPAGNRFIYGYQPTLNVTPISSLTYSGALPSGSSAVSVTGLLAGDSAGDAWSGAAALAGLTSKNVGTYAVTPSLGTLVSDLNYGFSFTPGTLTITPAALTLSAVTASKTYDATTASSSAPNVSGLLGSDTVTGLAQAYDNRNAGTRTLSIKSGYTVNDGNGGANYTVSTSSAVGTISRAALTLAAVTATKTYDGSSTASGTPTVSGLIGSDTVTGLSQVYDSKNAGARTLSVSAYTVNDGNGGANYTVSTNTAVGTISQAALILAAVTATKTYDGSSTASGTPTVSGLIGSDTVTGLSQAYDSKNAGARTLSVSAYTVNDGNGGANYTVSTNTAVGTISQAALILAAVTATKTYDANTASAGAPTVSGLVGADTVTGLSQTYDSRNAGARTLSVNGGYTVNDGNGGANYTVATTSAAGTISRAPLTLSAVTARKTYDGETTADGTPTAAGLKGSDTVTGLSQAFDSRNAGTRTVSVSTGYSVNDGNGGGNYAVTLNSASGAIDKRILALAADNKAKLEGQMDPPLTWTILSGAMVGGDALTGGLSRESGEGVGLYAILQGDLTAGANYQINFTNGRFEVRPRPFTTPVIPIIIEIPDIAVEAPVIETDLPVSGLSTCPRDASEPEGYNACELAPAGGAYD
jgi:filamentous hemagglutinin family protein